ncbi:MAG: VOC family protein [Bacteroidetes bacterium]|nr:VOC family protein [Bacteroidota bacterium]
MNLLSVRIITADVKRLAAFYEKITKSSVIFYTDDFAELQTKNATLAIGSTRTLQAFGGDDVAKAAQNKTAIIEFKVADVDDDYSRLSAFLEPYLVQKPTTMPWGNRSLLFRDPDGNLVNFFTPVTPDAIRKFEGEGVRYTHSLASGE